MGSEDKMRIIGQETITNLSARFELPVGKYRTMFIRFAGTNQTSQTLAVGNLGQVQLLVDGKQKWLFDFEYMQALINNMYGICQAASTISSTFQFDVSIPFFWLDDNDVAYTVASGKRVEIVHSFSQCTSTIVASGTVIYGLTTADDTALTPYEMRYMNHSFTFGAAGSFNMKLFNENIAMILVEADAQLTSLSLTRDGKTVYDNVLKADLIALSQHFNRIETYNASLGYIVLDLCGVKTDLAAQNDEIYINFVVAAACTINILIVSIDQSPKKLAVSSSLATASANRKATRKNQKNLPQIAGHVQSQR